MRSGRRQVENDVDLGVGDQLGDVERAQAVLRRERAGRVRIEVRARDRPPVLERARVPDVACSDHAAADDADAQRSAHTAPRSGGRRPRSAAWQRTRRRRRRPPRRSATRRRQRAPPAAPGRSRRRRPRPARRPDRRGSRSPSRARAGSARLVFSSSATGSTPACQTQPRSSSSQSRSDGRRRRRSRNDGPSSSGTGSAQWLWNPRRRSRSRAARATSANRSTTSPGRSSSSGSIQAIAARSVPSTRSSSASRGSSLSISSTRTWRPAATRFAESSQRAYLLHVVPVQLEELHAVVALRSPPSATRARDRGRTPHGSSRAATRRAARAQIYETTVAHGGPTGLVAT